MELEIMQNVSMPHAQTELLREKISLKSVSVHEIGN